METPKIKIGLVEDHVLVRKLMKSFLQEKGHDVILEASDGIELQQLIEGLKKKSSDLPDIILVDIFMPGMDGFATVTWLKKSFPTIPVIIVTMDDSETSVVKMLKLGVNGYCLKSGEPEEIHTAIIETMKKDSYFSHWVSRIVVKALKQEQVFSDIDELTEREIEFLKLCATELSYKEIAEKMDISVRTVDAYREHIFNKLKVNTRVGMVMYAIRENLISID